MCIVTTETLFCKIMFIYFPSDDVEKCILINIEYYYYRDAYSSLYYIVTARFQFYYLISL